MNRKIHYIALFALMVICGQFAVFAAPPFITPAMMKRNGLTDAQYEMLWKQGRNPKIDIATARDWIFRASRYQNVTNWLEICGRTNDFAKLSHTLQAENFDLTETNKVVVALAKAEKKAKEIVEGERDEARAERDSAKSERDAARKERDTAKAERDSAKAYEKRIKDIQKAARKDAKNLEKLVKDIKKYRNKASTEDFKELCGLLLEVLEGGAE